MVWQRDAQQAEQGGAAPTAVKGPANSGASDHCSLLAKGLVNEITSAPAKAWVAEGKGTLKAAVAQIKKDKGECACDSLAGGCIWRLA